MRRGGTGERGGAEGWQCMPAQCPPCLLASRTCTSLRQGMPPAPMLLPAPVPAQTLPLPAGEPKGQTYGGVYQPGPEERGAAEAATHAGPTRE